MRRNVELDLPSAFTRHYGPMIDQWLESAIPGSSLCIPLVAGPAFSPFVVSASLERNTITLRAVELMGALAGPAMLVEPADRHSRTLVDLEERRLTPNGGN
jgi:hypothetical protein